MVDNFDHFKKEIDALVEKLRNEIGKDPWNTLPVDKRDINKLIYRIKQLESGFLDIVGMDANTPESYAMQSRIIAKACYVGAINNESKYSFVPDLYFSEEGHGLT